MLAQNRSSRATATWPPSAAVDGAAVEDVYAAVEPPRQLGAEQRVGVRREVVPSTMAASYGGRGRRAYERGEDGRVRHPKRVIN